MDETRDLDAALNFVVGRIAQQAKLLGEPLSNEQRFLLDNLPSTPVSTHSLIPVHPEIVELIPRNINYERLCALAKEAYLNDRGANPESLDWEFAFAVFTLKHHPMWGLLHWAGVRIYHRSSRDLLLVVVAGLMPVIAVILVAWSGATIIRSAGILCGCIAVMLLIYLASRQTEQQQLENHIERCRLACRNIGWKSS